MKKLSLLISLILMISIHSLGQGTKDTIKKSSIDIPFRAAKEVVKDLVRGDSLVSENDILTKNVELLKLSISYKDSIIYIKDVLINLHKQKEDNYQIIETEKDKQLSIKDQTINKLRKDLKTVKRKKTFWDIVGGAAILGLGYLYITK